MVLQVTMVGELVLMSMYLIYWKSSIGIIKAIFLLDTSGRYETRKNTEIY